MISVCMATYNGQDFIETQLLSIVNQTVLPDEIIVVDDKSTDRTVEIVEKLASQYDSIKWKILINDFNIGWKKNFQKAICQSSGDIVFLADQDDYWCKNKIEILSMYMMGNKRILVLSSGYEQIVAEKMDAVNSRLVLETNEENLMKYRFNKAFYMNHHPGCSMVLRKEAIEWFNSKYWNGEQPHDEFIWTIALLYDRAYVLDEKLFYYLRHTGAATAKEKHSRKRQIERVKALLTCVETISDIISDRSDFSQKQEKQRIALEAKSFLIKRLAFLTHPSVHTFIHLLKKYKQYEKGGFFLADVYSSIR